MGTRHRLTLLSLTALLLAACGSDRAEVIDVAEEFADDDVADDAPVADDVPAPDDAPDAVSVDAPDTATDAGRDASDGAVLDVTALDVPRLDAPRDAPMIDAPAIDTPAIDTPAIDVRPVDVPVVDVPVVDVPVVDVPTTLPADWSTNATDHDCRLDGVVGMRFAYVCPPGGTLGSLWGTGNYTHDSSICTAAVHAGRITRAAGGTVVIEMRAAATSYTSSTRHEVTSSSYGAWYCSYAVVSPSCGGLRDCGGVCSDTLSDVANCGACGNACATGQACAAGRCTVMCPAGQLACADRCVDASSDHGNCGACGLACAVTEVCTAGVCGATGATWSTNATDHDCSAAGVVGTRFRYVCPPGGSAGAVWGTDVYTHDSSICTAAVHAGRITLAAGGSVTLQMQPGQMEYVASTRNGITSFPYGTWGCSYVFP